MVLETLRYADEVNKAASYFRDIGDTKPDEDLLDLATSLIEKKSGKFGAAEFHDRYVDALKDLIARRPAPKRWLNKPANDATARKTTTRKAPAKAPAKKPAARKVPARKSA